MTALAVSRMTGRPLLSADSRLAVAKAADGAPQQQVTMMDPPLESIIEPSVRDRWMSPDVKQYTAKTFEATIRSAMSGNLVAQFEMFDLMEATWPRLNKNLNELKDSALGYLGTFQPWAAKGKQPSPEAQRRADVIEEVLCNMEPEVAADENDFEDTIRDFMDARGKGISVLEIDYAVRDFSFGQAVAPRCTRWIHPRYYGYAPMPNGRDRLKLNVREIRNSASLDGTLSEGAAALLQDDGSGFADFPPNKFLIGIAKTKSGHPLGGAMLRTLGPWWIANNFAPSWFINYAQIFGMPFRWATYDTAMTQTDQGKLKAMMQFMGSAAWALFPAGTQMEFKEASKASGEVAAKVLLEYADKVCDIFVLRQTLTTDVGDSGSRAIGEVHERKETGVQMNVARWAAKGLQRQLIKPVCQFNFGDTLECPWLMAVEEEDFDPQATAQFVEVANRTVDLPRTWAYEKLKIPQPAAGEDVIPVKSNPQISPMGADLASAKATLLVQAKDATDKLIDAGLEQLTGVQAKWLAGVKPFFVDLLAKAKDGQISDAEFEAFLVNAKKKLPELFSKFDTQALAKWFNDGMGAALANGALRGAMQRGSARASRATVGASPTGGVA